MAGCGGMESGPWLLDSEGGVFGLGKNEAARLLSLKSSILIKRFREIMIFSIDHHLSENCVCQRWYGQRRQSTFCKTLMYLFT